MKTEILPIRPIHDRVLIRRLPDQPRTDGLIIVRENPGLVDVISNDLAGEHDDYRRVPLMGVIVAVGPGKWDDDFKFQPTHVKPGEVVIFSDWNDWEDAPEDLYLIQEGDIWGYPHGKEAN